MEIVYEPWKRIVIHEIIQYDLETLADLHSLGLRYGQIGRPVNWANGVAFEYVLMSPTEDVVRDQMGGTIHWLHLHFASMPEHQRFFTVPQTRIKIPVLDMSEDKIMVDMTKWLKERYLKK